MPADPKPPKRDSLPRRAFLRRRRKRAGVHEQILRTNWIYELAVRATPPGEELPRCEVTGETELEAAERLEGHHIIEKEHLRQHFPSGHNGRTLTELVWDPRNGLLVRHTIHRRHTSRHEPIPQSALPEEAREFARELGLEWYLAGRYTAEDAA